jgi:small subunit ribosomal protein S15
MSLVTKEKAKIIQEFGKTATDTGSPEVQIALLTNEINSLTEHFKTHAKDHHSRKGLIRKVTLRRKMLEYLKKNDFKSYREVIAKLNLRG